MKDCKCEKCGKEFRVADTKVGKYCSKACYDVGRRKYEKHPTCEKCGKVFENYKGTHMRFCSRECFETTSPGRLLKPKTCTHCKKEFQPRWDTQVCCSRECGAAGRRRTDRPAECAYCKGPMKPNTPRHVRFCSRSCGRLAYVNSPRTKRTIGNVVKANRGYMNIKVPHGYPGADKFGWMKHHRYVYQEHRRQTEPDFVLLTTHHIHHKDGNRGNNVIENLELTIVRGEQKMKHVPGQRVDDLIAAVTPEEREKILATITEADFPLLAKLVAAKNQRGFARDLKQAVADQQATYKLRRWRALPPESRPKFALEDYPQASDSWFTNNCLKEVCDLLVTEHPDKIINHVVAGGPAAVATFKHELQEAIDRKNNSTNV